MEDHTYCPDKYVKGTVLDVRSAAEVDELDVAIAVEDDVFVFDVAMYN